MRGDFSLVFCIYIENYLEVSFFFWGEMKLMPLVEINEI